MRVKLEDLSPEKRAAVQDFKSDITSVFNDIYGDKWDQERWDRAVGGLFSSPLLPPDLSNVYFLIVRHPSASASGFSRLTSVRFSLDLLISRWTLYIVSWLC